MAADLEPGTVAPAVTAGVVFAFRKQPGTGLSSSDVWATSLRLCELVEELGFDEVWLSEHHGATDEYLPTPLIVAAAVGARTSRLRIGTFALLAPFYHPVRLAEDCAAIDTITNGRFLLGIGLGYRAEEFAALGIDRSQRAGLTEEIIDIVIKCWTEDEFNYEGKFFTLSNVRCVPKPVQKPRIPVWIGGYAPVGALRAARLGDGWLGTGRKSFPGAREAYLAEVEANGRTTQPPMIANSDLPLYQFCTNDPDRDRPIIEDLVRKERQMVARWQTEGNGVPEQEINLDDEVIVATPETFVKEIQASYERAPFSKYVLNPLLDTGAPVDMVTSSLELFASEVLPAVHALGRA